MHTAVLLLRDTLLVGGSLAFAWEQDRQASGPGRRKPRVFAAAAAALLGVLLTAYA
ncbi:hypothetical protein ACFV06_14180 [Streptomyces sp. NPDC059618]|uniref:hypothetical protein n=1 Tax=Streptomyces sp. NPDC059618 TaxID=3346887 RepID=UPI0036A6B3D6